MSGAPIGGFCCAENVNCVCVGGVVAGFNTVAERFGYTSTAPKGARITGAESNCWAAVNSNKDIGDCKVVTDKFGYTSAHGGVANEGAELVSCGLRSGLADICNVVADGLG